MKNIHILSTDKPSKLFNCFGKLEIGDYVTTRENLQVTNQNIYITNDEEIKYGDYRYSLIQNNIVFVTGFTLKVNKEYWKLNNHTHKKIILTTDQDLIKDGVQAIDDEFLSWFIKNPSCEEVHTEKYHGINSSIAEISAISGSDDYNWKGRGDLRDYKIIIPKEEPDYTALLQPVGTKQECKGSFKDCFKPLDECVCDTIKQQQKKILIEMMQEDEELGLYNEKLEEDGTIIQFLCGSHSYDGVWFGDKHPYREGNFWWRSILKEWQAERMYSEEEVLIILYKHTEDLLVGKKITLEEWFKQFKKK